MVVKTIVDDEAKRKWVIIKVRDDNYTIDYYEFYQALGWKVISRGKEIWSKAAIEDEFECEVD